MTPRLHAALLLALALAGCGAAEEQADPLPPTDRFYYPTGVATTATSAGTAALVASSNFDLRYSATEGGTLLSVPPTAGAGAIVPISAERIASYAGAVAAVDDATCPGAGIRLALVPSRFEDVLYRFDLGTDGALACADGRCALPLSGGAFDPFPVAVACGPAGNRAYVGYLRAPETSPAAGEGAWLAEVELDTDAATRVKPARIFRVGDGPVRSVAYEAAADRLWIAARSSGERTLLYSAVLSDPTWQLSPLDAVDVVDLFPAVRGSELRSIAVGTPQATGPRRLYATVRLYDVEAQASSGGTRPAGDVGGALLVLDVTDDPSTGRPVVSVRKIISLQTGIGDVAVISRGSAQRDVVVVTALDGDLLYVYDDDVGDVVCAQEIGHSDVGLPLVGDRPMALAIDPTPRPGDGRVAAYVASFGSHLVSRVWIDPAQPWLPATIETIGGLAP